MPENRQCTRSSPITSFNTLLKDAAQKVEIGLHGTKYTKIFPIKEIDQTRRLQVDPDLTPHRFRCQASARYAEVAQVV